MATNQEDRIAALEAKVQELHVLVGLALRLLSIEKPISAVLSRYGATETEHLAVHALLDDMVQRAAQGGMYALSFGGFVGELFTRFPGVRGNKAFLFLLVDTLKVNRPAYQKLDAFISTQVWPKWT